MLPSVTKKKLFTLQAKRPPNVATMTTELGNPHDRFFKEVWSRKTIGRDFLRRYLPRKVVATLDLKALELVKGSFVDPQLREYHSDLLYRLRLKDGEPALAYVLLEHKRQPKRSTPLQLLGYIVQLWQQAAEQSNGSGRAPPVIPVVVYHGDQPWPYGQTLQSALPFPALLAPYLPDFRYVLCDLSGLDAAEIQGNALRRVALLTMKYIGDPQLAARLPEIFGLLSVFGEQRTVLGYLETLLRYLAAAAVTISEADVRPLWLRFSRLWRNVSCRPWLKPGWNRAVPRGWPGASRRVKNGCYSACWNDVSAKCRKPIRPASPPPMPTPCCFGVNGYCSHNDWQMCSASRRPASQRDEISSRKAK